MSFLNLDKKDIKLIELVNSEHFVTISFLAKELNVSERSIRNYIKQINYELLGVLEISTSRKKGAYINIISNNKFIKLLESFNVIAPNNLFLNNKNDRIKYIVNFLLN